MSDHPTLGRFVTQRLNAEKRNVAKSETPDDYGGVHEAVALAVVYNYPGLSEFERGAVFASLRADADRMAIQMNQGVSRILGLNK